MARTRETVRRYPNEKRMRRDMEYMSKRGWTVKNVQVQTDTSRNAGCGCLFGLFGGGSSRSINRHSYLVVYEQRS